MPTNNPAPSQVETDRDTLRHALRQMILVAQGHSDIPQKTFARWFAEIVALAEEPPQNTQQVSPTSAVPPSFAALLAAPETLSSTDRLAVLDACFAEQEKLAPDAWIEIELQSNIREVHAALRDLVVQAQSNIKVTADRFHEICRLGHTAEQWTYRNILLAALREMIQVSYREVSLSDTSLARIKPLADIEVSENLDVLQALRDMRIYLASRSKGSTINEERADEIAALANLGAAQSEHATIGRLLVLTSRDLRSRAPTEAALLNAYQIQVNAKVTMMDIDAAAQVVYIDDAGQMKIVKDRFAGENEDLPVVTRPNYLRNVPEYMRQAFGWPLRVAPAPEQQDNEAPEAI